MKKHVTHFNSLALVISFFALAFAIQSCEHKEKEVSEEIETETSVLSVKPEYFQLRPEVETAYGYTHAVKIGSVIKVSGAVSMDDQGNPTAVGDLTQQMKNCYTDLEKILAHYGCSFDDVVEENIFTTDMPLFLENAGYRNTIYTGQFPTGSWLGVKELALPELMIEIELEAHKPE